MAELGGITQTAIGKQCRPRAVQAVVSQFELAETRLTHARAEQFAAGYFAELWDTEDDANRKLAVSGVWGLWFENVAAYGSPEMRREALALKSNWSRYPWEKPPVGLFADEMDLTLQSPAKPTSEVRYERQSDSSYDLLRSELLPAVDAKEDSDVRYALSASAEG